MGRRGREATPQNPPPGGVALDVTAPPPWSFMAAAFAPRAQPCREATTTDGGNRDGSRAVLVSPAGAHDLIQLEGSGQVEGQQEGAAGCLSPAKALHAEGRWSWQAGGASPLPTPQSPSQALRCLPRTLRKGGVTVSTRRLSRQPQSPARRCGSRDGPLGAPGEGPEAGGGVPWRCEGAGGFSLSHGDGRPATGRFCIWGAFSHLLSWCISPHVSLPEPPFLPKFNSCSSETTRAPKSCAFQLHKLHK